LSARSPWVEDSGRLRVAWRLVIFILLSVACVYLVTAIAAADVRSGGAPARAVLEPLVLPVALLLAHGVMLRWVDPRPWTFVGLGIGDAGPKAVGFGALLGAATIAVPTAVLLMAGQYVLVPATQGAWLAATVRTSAFLLPAALWEELFFRGYPFAALQESAGWKWALAGTAFTFGLAHAQNVGATAESVVIVIVAGYFLGLLRIVTGSLYATWAAHFMWNWVMACGFHVAVSGNPFARPDYALVPRGADWLTGGAWGPEGGFAAALALFAVVFYLYGKYLKPAGVFERHD